MTRIVATAIVLCTAGTAVGGVLPAPVFRPVADAPWWSSSETPKHPAVARVIVTERDGFSLGSGALVAVNQEHGLVVTNWHVVRDAAGPVTVVFPDGFRSGATVLKTDRDWDLAALAVWRPNAQPIALAGEAPRHGEPLTIIGYGSGQYRAATGRCVQYLSPGKNLPAELVELSVAARQGDSGGPILNPRGELAGILFGASFGRTAGSYSGRVRQFLGSVADEFRDGPQDGTMIAQRPPAFVSGPASMHRAAGSGAAPVASIPAPSVASRPAPSDSPAPGGEHGPWVAPRGAHSAASGSSRAGPTQSGQPRDAAPTWDDPVKTFLAVVGGIAILLQAVKLFSSGGTS